KTTTTMKRFSLKFLPALLLLGSLNFSYGQSTCIRFVNGSNACHNNNTIAKLVVASGDLNLHLTNQNVQSFALTTIRSITFSTGTSGQAQQREQVAFRMYPNPATNILTIETTSQHRSSGTIEIISLDGRTLISLRSNFENSTNQVDVSSLAQGAYICKIRNGNQVSSLQFVKQ
ncbi:MAG: T9SS type A sorting domain-containing protein, partial [Bacteroidales bacterium]|nr:T9SS type A sorting domain-containing protein [Bacteroidales bacterium]